MSGELMPLRADPLTRLSDARGALDSARDLSEVKAIRDVALAAREYARARKLGAEARDYAQEIINRAERRIGELLPPREPGPGRGKTFDGQANVSARQRIGYQVSARSQLLAAMPEEVFEANVRRPVSSVAAIARAHRASELRRVPVPDLASIGPFPVLLADPPWRYETVGRVGPSRQIDAHYPTMALPEIKALKIPAAEDAVLFLWSTPPKLMEAGDVMAAWDFTYRTCLVWVKDRIGMGYYARQRHELLLIGKRGNFAAPFQPAPDSVITAPRGAHSAKPAEAYELIEFMYPGLPYCELFARQSRPGWAAWGNQIRRAS